MKKMAIMQPYFFPYIGYFALIQHVDAYILLDDVQFMRHSWIERNRILKPSAGWQYIGVPLKKHPMKARIKAVEINHVEDWKGKIMRQLQHYGKKAPYYAETMQVIHSALAIETNSITKLNAHCLKTVCDYLNIQTPIYIFSEMNVAIEAPMHADEWALNICKSLKANEYWNPINGRAIFDVEKYDQNSIELKFFEAMIEPYNQRRAHFETHLSIIDVMMFNSNATIQFMLEQYRIEPSLVTI